MADQQKESKRQDVLSNWTHMMDQYASDMLSTVAIYGRQDDLLVKDRTGVLFAVGDRHFILTAAHDLDDFAKHKIPLYTAPTTLAAFRCLSMSRFEQQGNGHCHYGIVAICGGRTSAQAKVPSSNRC